MCSLSTIIVGLDINKDDELDDHDHDHDHDCKNIVCNDASMHYYGYGHPSYNYYAKGVGNGGCVGTFFQLFDWNRRLNSNSKRFFFFFSDPHNVQEKAKKKKKTKKNLQIQGARHPQKLLHFIDAHKEEARDMNDCSSSRARIRKEDDNDNISNAKSPGVVLKLMGLESLPNHAALRENKEGNHLAISEQRAGTRSRERSRKQSTNIKNSYGSQEAREHVSIKMESGSIDASKFNTNWKWKRRGTRVHHKHRCRNLANTNPSCHPHAEDNDMDANATIFTMPKGVEGYDSESASDSIGCQPSPVSVLVSPFDEEPFLMTDSQGTWRIKCEQDYVAAVVAATADNKLYVKEAFESVEERVTSWSDSECGPTPWGNRMLLFDCVKEAMKEEEMMWKSKMDPRSRFSNGMMWRWQAPCGMLVSRLYERICRWRRHKTNISNVACLNDWYEFDSEMNRIISSLEHIILRILLDDLLYDLNPQHPTIPKRKLTMPTRALSLSPKPKILAT